MLSPPSTIYFNSPAQHHPSSLMMSIPKVIVTQQSLQQQAISPKTSTLPDSPSSQWYSPVVESLLDSDVSPSRAATSAPASPVLLRRRQKPFKLFQLPFKHVHTNTSSSSNTPVKGSKSSRKACVSPSLPPPVCVYVCVCECYCNLCVCVCGYHVAPFSCADVVQEISSYCTHNSVIRQRWLVIDLY